MDVTNAEELQDSDLDLLLLDNIGLAYAEQHELLVDLYAYLDKDFWPMEAAAYSRVSL